MSDRIWSEQQKAIFEWFGVGHGHLVVRARAGCLAGDTVLNINRASKGTPMPIEKVVAQISGNPPLIYRPDLDCYQRARPWNLALETRIARADDDRVRLGVVAGAWCSGVKETFTLTTETGRSIRATAEHPFLLENGSWAELGSLSLGSRVRVNVGQGGTDHAAKLQYSQRDTKYHPHQVGNGKNRWKVAEHRLIVEAGMNGLPLDEYLDILRIDAARASRLHYLSESQIVHHKDGDELNNDHANLMVLGGAADHSEHHDWGVNVLSRVGAETVVSVESFGEELTYDVAVQDDPHCFLANGFVVHNTGKTTTILEAINYAPEQTILLAAFNKRIADHLKGKLQNPRAEAKTLHSVGYAFITERWGYIKPADRDERADDLTRQACEALGSVDVPFQILRLISKLNTKARELTPHATTPEQLDYIVEQFECEPDEEFEAMGYDTAFVVTHALKAMVLAMAKPKRHEDTGYAGGIDFADMIYLPIRNKWLRPKYDLVVVDEAQDMAAAQLEIAQGICKGRICVVGDDRQCQPAGTMVRSTQGADVRIETLNVGDHIESFDRHGQVFIKSGRVNAISSLEYRGPIITVKAGKKISRSTPNHRWLVRWTNKSDVAWVTYLMRQGNRYRVGQCQLFRLKGEGMFGLAQRARVERADAAWVLGIHHSIEEALAYEQILSARYGLPEMVFCPPSTIKHFTRRVIDLVYDAFPAGELRGKALKCLADHGRDEAFPIYIKAERYTRRGRTTIFETEGCNLLSHYMAAPVAPDMIPGHDKKDRHAVEWRPLEVSTLLTFEGIVYSLDIDRYHKYVADGLVTCNSIYGFRGADSNAIDRLKAALQAEELSLFTTYRCGHAIVRHNARLVPDFNAHHENHAGVIRIMPHYMAMVAEAAPGDFVLSRKNAPLAEIAMALIRANKRVKIAGRDIGRGLEAVAKKLATGAAERSIPMFLQKLQTWTEKECKRAMKAAKSEAAGYAKCDAIRDKADTLAFLTDGILSVRELLVRIGELFPKREDGTDVDPSTVVLCSSIHKAKGLEAERVYVLVDTLYALPKQGKVSADRRREEENLDYVACTRAINTLVLVGQTAHSYVQCQLPNGVQDAGVVVPSGASTGSPVTETVEELVVKTAN